MIRLYIVAEGQTEQTFVNKLLRPHLEGRGVEVRAPLLGKPGHKGGAVSYARATDDVLSFLKHDPQAYCTTFFDFQGRGKGWPKIAMVRKGSVEQKAQAVEKAFHADIVRQMGHAFRPERFIPYVQMHEFEGLLFSAPEALASVIGQPQLEKQFRAIRTEFPTPEDIDDGAETAPSRRIRAVARNYDKVDDGSRVALRIGLAKIRSECAHFHVWVKCMESLGGACS